ncbi:hypothetical protein JCM30237_11190 [Halolamina litorea]|uniref:Uncharacterized protein n=1 Tax=Halolamina litorea TaxID=1515593 RepID=A0ABD6BL85_9EURY|nr:hypothetical protein [Halolamina litorea]
MRRDLRRLLAQPAVFAFLYGGASVVVAVIGLVDTAARGAVVVTALLVGSYVAVTRVLPLPHPDRPVHMTRYDTVDDVVVNNDAKLVLSAVVPVATLLPFLFLPVSVYDAVGLGLVGLLLVGAYLAEAWAVFRLTAQYLPPHAPHLFGDDYEPPLD